MSDDQIVAEVKRCVLNLAAELKKPVPQLELSGKLVDDYGLDSLSLITLAVSIEETFALDIDEEAILDGALESVASVVAFVKTKKASVSR